MATEAPALSPQKTAKLTTTSSATNRRGAQRRPPRTNVVIEVRKGHLGLGKNICFMFLDVSEGGVRVIIKEELESKAEVEVQLIGHGMRRPLKALGHVRWAMRLDNGMYCVGVQFEKRLPYREIMPLFKP
jgi:hypothetical protein